MMTVSTHQYINMMNFSEVREWFDIPERVLTLIEATPEQFLAVFGRPAEICRDSENRKLSVWCAHFWLGDTNGREEHKVEFKVISNKDVGTSYSIGMGHDGEECCRILAMIMLLLHPL